VGFCGCCRKNEVILFLRLMPQKRVSCFLRLMPQNEVFFAAAAAK
jgi:hypothetical protein